MEEAAEVLDRAKISRMEILRPTVVEDCAQQCEGMWLQCAYEVISNSNIHPDVFATTLGDRIEDRSGKFRNIIIIDPANSGKTILLALLQIVFKRFSNLASVHG